VTTKSTTPDAAFCASVLPSVSRTFALSIEALPGATRDAVRAAYLLCRIVDTIEDEARLPEPRRQSMFDVFESQIADDAARPELLEEALEGIGGLADLRLCRGSGAVLRVFRGLDAPAREAVRPHVLEMSRGMREYAVRASMEGSLRIRDLRDLERYCYFVAGTVGGLLTSLFALLVGAVPPDSERRISQNGTAFGLGLQLVNIVKDVAADLSRGTCFVPADLMDAAGLDPSTLLVPECRPRALAVLGHLVARAHAHLEAAEDYTLAWPVPAGESVRLFCAVPLVLARATLAEVERGSDTLIPGRSPKVGRGVVARALAGARAAVGDDGRLAAFLRDASTPPDVDP